MIHNTLEKMMWDTFKTSLVAQHLPNFKCENLRFRNRPDVNKLFPGPVLDKWVSRSSLRRQHDTIFMVKSKTTRNWIERGKRERNCKML